MPSSKRAKTAKKATKRLAKLVINEPEFLEKLPVELLARVCQGITLDDLASLIRASPFVLRVLGGDQRRVVLLACARATIAPEAWDAAVAAVRCPVHQELVPPAHRWKTTFGIRRILSGPMKQNRRSRDTQTRANIMQVFLAKVVSGTLDTDNYVSLEEVLAICHLWNLIKGFIADFALRTIDQIEAIAIWPERRAGPPQPALHQSQASMRDTAILRDLHPSELARLQRGFFRYEFVCRLVRPRRFHSEVFPRSGLGTLLRTRFPRWQMEEIATVYEYVLAQYGWMQVDVSEMTKAACPTPISAQEVVVRNLQNWELVTEDHGRAFLKGFATGDDEHHGRLLSRALAAQGLPLLYKTLHKDASHLSQTLVDISRLLAFPAAPSSVLGILTDLNFLRADTSRNEGANMVREFVDPAPDHWNAGWTLYHRSIQNNFDLRHAGVIFWESSRMVNILHLPRDTHEARKLRHNEPTPHKYTLLSTLQQYALERQMGSSWRVLRTDWDRFVETWQLKDRTEIKQVAFLQEVEALTRSARHE